MSHEMGYILMPEGIRLHYHKFGKRPVTPVVDVPTGPDPQPPFQINWEDQEYGLTVVVREREDGRLVADASCADAGMMHKMALAVGLVGAADALPISKTVPLDTLDGAGCRGSANLGPLADAVKHLGTRIALVVFRLY